MQFLSYFHDPDDLFVDLLTNTENPEELRGSVVAVSPQTTAKMYEIVKEKGFTIIEGGPYGYARLEALKKSLETDDKYYFVCDFDKMLHWLETNKQEFLELFSKDFENDVTIIARSETALITYPKTWIETEQIVSKIVEKVIGKNIDIMNGPLIVSKKAGELIAKYSKETGVGSCTEWCLIAQQHNLKIGEIKVDGLTWEDPDRYSEAINKSENFETWKEEVFDSLYEWRKRVEFLHKQVEVMIRLNEEPINPKYPNVSNPVFEE